MTLADFFSVIEELMSNGYSELQHLNLGFVYGRLNNTSASLYRYGRKWEIMIDNRFKTSKKSVVRGLLCHELSHLIRMEGIKPRMRNKDMLFCSNGLYEYLDERNTDLDVILRGHGGDLLSFKMSKVSNREKERTGLSLYEIKKLIE